MLRSLPELMVMIKGMVTAAASVGYTLALLMIITYVFSIAFRNLVPPGSDIEEAYFSSVPEAMHNLIVFATFLDELSSFILMVKAESPTCFVVSWIYISLAALTVMNMLIGVLCEVVSAVAESEREEAAIRLMKNTILVLLKHFDEDENGSISKVELAHVMSDPQALEVLKHLEVDVDYLQRLQGMVYDEDVVQVPIEDILELMLQCRADLPTTVKHMVVGQELTRWALSSEIKEYEEQLQKRLAYFGSAMAQEISLLKAVLMRMQLPGPVTPSGQGPPVVPATQPEPTPIHMNPGSLPMSTDAAAVWPL
eukprot:gnl/TRDRNA2_/TRDRNA2_176591_c7_seq23.p1 gnl/TRDRNA2_/TRDRNA2_176591_c7~~gnl/TRDRNA2_/TRDRNA2_176591_c7_seq23.p1  ORF type:complete len:310 (+),score=60.81 gnl/TRDRNA2_/TRDRNA2_176591_c7_seq23:265-1194(+)